MDVGCERELPAPSVQLLATGSQYMGNKYLEPVFLPLVLAITQDGRIGTGLPNWLLHLSLLARCNVHIND